MESRKGMSTLMMVLIVTVLLLIAAAVLLSPTVKTAVGLGESSGQTINNTTWGFDDIIGEAGGEQGEPSNGEGGDGGDP